MRYDLFSFPPLTEMFYFSGFALRLASESYRFLGMGLLHSETLGSKVARHLPQAYRRHAASFIAQLISSHPPYALISRIARCNHICFPGILPRRKCTYELLTPAIPTNRPLNWNCELGYQSSSSFAKNCGGHSTTY